MTELGKPIEPRAGFTDPLPKADVLVMGHILHDRNLDEKRLLLQTEKDWSEAERRYRWQG